MSEPVNKAVFLSYASQDAEAARKICDALGLLTPPPTRGPRGSRAGS